MLDMCNYFYRNFFKSYKMSVAKVKVAQNRHVYENSNTNCRLCSIEIQYSLGSARGCIPSFDSVIIVGSTLCSGTR